MKMYFAKRVKYQGITYPANTAIEVKDEEADDLKLAGGWEVEANEGTTNDEDVNRQNNTTQADDKDWTLEELKEIAKDMGIEVKGNWGIKKLQTIIKEAQK